MVRTRKQCLRSGPGETTFLSLPWELRNMIYIETIQPDHCSDLSRLFHEGDASLRCLHGRYSEPEPMTHTQYLANQKGRFRGCTSIMRTCRQIYEETRLILRSLPRVVFFPLWNKSQFFCTPPCHESPAHVFRCSPKLALDTLALESCQNLHVEIAPPFLKYLNVRWHASEETAAGEYKKLISKLVDQLGKINLARLRALKVYIPRYPSELGPPPNNEVEKFLQAFKPLARLLPASLDVSIVYGLRTDIDWFGPWDDVFQNHRGRFWSDIPGICAERFTEARKEAMRSLKDSFEKKARNRRHPQRGGSEGHGLVWGDERAII